MSRQRNVLVASSITNAPTTLTALTSGQLGILRQDYTGALTAIANATTVATYPRILIAVGKGTGQAPDVVTIEGKGVITLSNAVYTVGARKSIVAGYTGISTGTLPINLYSSYEYGVRIMPVDEDNEGTKWEPSGVYKSFISAYNTPAASQGRYAILKGLMDEINTDTNLAVKAYLRQSETLTVLAGNATVVNGSTTVTCTHASAMVDGDFIQLGFSFYKVSDVVAGSFTIDRAWEGVSETIKFNQSPPTGCTIVATNGSTLVTCDDTTNVTTIAVGDYINLSNVAYKVLSVIVDESFVIDRPYEGATETFTGADLGTVPAAAEAVLGSAGFVANATVDENTLFGFHFEADNYNENFDINLEEGFDGDEAVTRNTMVYQIGTYAEVLEQSQWSDPAFGTMNKTFIPDTRTQIAASTGTYNKWSIVYNNYIPGTDGTGRSHDNECELIIYVLDDIGTFTINTLALQVLGGNGGANWLEDYLLNAPASSGAFAATIDVS